MGKDVTAYCAFAGTVALMVDKKGDTRKECQQQQKQEVFQLNRDPGSSAA